MRQLLLPLAIALVAGCSLLPLPAGIQLSLPAAGDVGPHPVTVVDHAGIVRAATPGGPTTGPGAGPGPAFDLVPGRDDQVLVTWIGGECDDRTIVTIDPDAGRYRVHIDPQSSATSCSAVGVIRTVLLTLDQAVAPDSFEAG
jgi:hypothetical protein